MSIIPELKIGFFNAWLPAAPLILAGWIYLKAVSLDKAKRLIDRSWATSKDIKIGAIFMILIYCIVFYSIFVPLLPFTNIWFILGIIIYFFGLILMLVSYFNYASTPIDEPIVKGIYKISRNPMYFFATVGYFGISIASGSLIMFILILLFSGFQHLQILNEERYCLKTYGKEYQEYMKKVPRYFILKRNL